MLKHAYRAGHEGRAGMNKKTHHVPFVSFAPYMRGGDATLNNSQSGAEHKVTRWW